MSISSIKSIPSIASIEPTAAQNLAATLPRETLPGLAANAALVLIGVTMALLQRQLNRLSADFLRVGGFREKMYRHRSAQRRKDE